MPVLHRKNPIIHASGHALLILCLDLRHSVCRSCRKSSEGAAQEWGCIQEGIIESGIYTTIHAIVCVPVLVLSCGCLATLVSFGRLKMPIPFFISQLARPRDLSHGPTFIFIYPNVLQFKLVVEKEGSATENAPSPQGQYLVLKGASIRGSRGCVSRRCCRLWTGSVRWEGPDPEDLRTGTAERAASGGWREGGWRDVTPEQIGT